MFCLPGRTAGFHAAKAKGGYNSISNSQVKSEEKNSYELSVFLDLRSENGEGEGSREPSWLPKP